MIKCKLINRLIALNECLSPQFRSTPGALRATTVLKELPGALKLLITPGVSLAALQAAQKILIFNMDQLFQSLLGTVWLKGERRRQISNHSLKFDQIKLICQHILYKYQTEIFGGFVTDIIVKSSEIGQQEQLQIPSEIIKPFNNWCAISLFCFSTKKIPQF